MAGAGAVLVRERMMQADYVIVGAGSAGCVLANRLTEDPATRVILIEAGGRDWNPLIHIPVGYMKLLDHKQLTWGFKAEADPGTNGRAIAYPRGRVLGGSSSINGLIYIRSQPEDYDYWAQLGNRGWGWDDVLPFFKRAERWTGEEAEIHGTEGHLTTSPMTERPQACHAIIGRRRARARIPARRQQPAARRRQFDRLVPADPRRAPPRQRRARPTSAPRKSGRTCRSSPTRWCIACCSTAGARSGSNFRAQAGPERVDAACEVILSAGAIGSPHLLQLSGVGWPEVLQKAGIAVQHALPGVGRNFQDHYIARMSCYVRDLETLNERARGLGFANEIMRYFVQGKGMMTFGASLCAASVKVLPESATPDVQCVFAPASYKPGLIRKLDERPGITGGPWQMRPLSRGYVLVRTPDPRDQPAINPRYLAEDTDQRAIVGGLKFLRRLFAAPALANHIVEENVPGPERAKRRRIARLRPLERFDRLPCELLVHDGQSRHVGRR